MATTHNQPSLRDLTPQQIVALCDFLGGSGHSIILLEEFPEDIRPYVARFEVTYRSDMSDPTGKSIIYSNVDGKPMKQLSGVNSLRVYEALTRAIGAEGSRKEGRGSRARELDEHIRTKVANS